MEIFIILVSCMIAAFPLLSVHQMMQTKSSKDHSILGASFIVFGVASWAGYGFYFGDSIVMWCNVGIVLAQLSMLITILYYRRLHEKQKKLVDGTISNNYMYAGGLRVPKVQQSIGPVPRQNNSRRI